MGTILVIDDNETIREGLHHTIKAMGHTVLTAAHGVEGIELAKSTANIDFVISDLKMAKLDGMEVLRRIKQLLPQTPAMIMTGFGTVEAAVEAMKLGAFDFLTKPFAPEVIQHKVTQALELVAARRARHKLLAHNEYLQEQADRACGIATQLIGDSTQMQPVYRAIRKVAKTDSAVLIMGESGTGKELIARAIHQRSNRANEPFIKVNCAAITDSLMESELFGHEKGAFTGAIKQRLGRFELAHKGTLFLDEIGDISASMQVKLLRVLQEKQFERVGGETTLTVDVRVLSATNKNLVMEVENGHFRQDLYYRLNVVPIPIPPLRDRSGDIAALVHHFIQKLAPRVNAIVSGIEDTALARMMAYPWPGNVRELENLVEQTLVFCEGEQIREQDLPTQLRGSSENTLKVPPVHSLPDILEDLEKQLIVRAYTKANRVKTEAARLLGIKTSALYYKLEKYHIE